MAQLPHNALTSAKEFARSVWTNILRLFKFRDGGKASDQVFAAIVKSILSSAERGVVYSHCSAATRLAIDECVGYAEQIRAVDHYCSSLSDTIAIHWTPIQNHRTETISHNHALVFLIGLATQRISTFDTTSALSKFGRLLRSRSANRSPLNRKHAEKKKFIQQFSVQTSLSGILPKFSFACVCEVATTVES